MQPNSYVKHSISEFRTLYRLLLIFLLISFYSVTNAQQVHDGSRKAAAVQILQKIIGPSTLNHQVTAFLSLEPLQPGDTIVPYIDGDPIIIREPSWFCWIDDDPFAFFAHPCRYVFITTSTGQMTIEHEEWWPELNGESLWMGGEELDHPELLIYSDKHLKNPGDD